jgi:hypothetical protein
MAALADRCRPYQGREASKVMTVVQAMLASIPSTRQPLTFMSGR